METNLKTQTEKTIDIPTFEVKAEGKFKSRRDSKFYSCYLVFECPKCHEIIHHGGVYGKKGGGDGHRVSHCRCWEKGYYIKEV